MMRLVLLVSFAILCAVGQAAESEFPTLESAVSSLYPGIEVDSSQTGDLNEDGRPEVAVILKQSHANGVEQMMRVVVFATTEQGRLRRWIETKSVYDCKHGTALSIDRSSLILACVSSIGADGADNISSELQFRFRRGTLLLVGEEAQIISDMNGPNERRHTFSRNFLTGRTVERQGRIESTKLDPAIKESAVSLADWGGW